MVAIYGYSPEGGGALDIDVTYRSKREVIV
jgi:hypothetical protein